jgi:hypothetical protein
VLDALRGLTPEYRAVCGCVSYAADLAGRIIRADNATFFGHIDDPGPFGLARSMRLRKGDRRRPPILRLEPSPAFPPPFSAHSEEICVA